MRADAMLEVGDLDGYGVYNRRRCLRRGFYLLFDGQEVEELIERR